MKPDHVTRDEFLALEKKHTDLESLFVAHRHSIFDKTKALALPAYVHAHPATIATTSTTDIYVIAPYNGTISSCDFSGVDALAASDTNYITFSITNLGQAGAGSAAVLAATNANTTKSTGGSALAANTRRQLTMNTDAAQTVVAEGDRLRIRASVTGTLANTVTFPTYLLRLTRAV